MEKLSRCGDCLFIVRIKPLTCHMSGRPFVKVWRHPDAEKLYCESIDIGEAGGPRQVVSGLVEHIPEVRTSQACSTRFTPRSLT
jgi:hypothetical protein